MRKFIFSTIKNLLVLLLISKACILNGQTTAHPTKTLDLIASETCESLTKQKNEIKTKQQFEAALGMCIMQSAANKMEGIKKELGVKDFNEETGNKLGEKIGFKLAASCPVFMELSMKIYGSESKTASTVDSVAVSADNQYIGKVKKLNSDGYVTITVENAEGKESKFMWIEYFKGSDKYKANLQQLVGTNMVVSWKEKEIFNGEMKDYINIKEITGLEKQ